MYRKRIQGRKAKLHQQHKILANKNIRHLICTFHNLFHSHRHFERQPIMYNNNIHEHEPKTEDRRQKTKRPKWKQ